MRNRIYKKCMHMCMDLLGGPSLNEISYNDIDMKKVIDNWYEIFVNVCVLLGIDSKSAKVLWNELAYGNWIHLHQTEEESKYSEEEWFKEFYWDMFYCSDRWSLDRLTRCHWRFRQWFEKRYGMGDLYER